MSLFMSYRASVCNYYDYVIVHVIPCLCLYMTMSLFMSYCASVCLFMSYCAYKHLHLLQHVNKVLTCACEIITLYKCPPYESHTMTCL